MTCLCVCGPLAPPRKDTENDAALSVTQRFGDVEIGMRKLAAYVCQYNLAGDSLAVAEGLTERGKALLRKGGVYRESE